MTRVYETFGFLRHISPGALLDPVLKPSLEDETELRRLFATDKAHPRLSNPYVGLVDVFDAPADVRTTRARVVKEEMDLAAQYVMPLSEINRRKEGTLSMLIDWSNVVAAGGAVLACLTPLSDAAKASKRSIRKYYHSAGAEVKITKIYEAVRDSVPWDVTCVRTKHTVSIHSQYPYRSVQIVLRLYSSPAEILAGFDIDAPCCAYDGTRVYANPRAIVAMMRQCNTVDMTRRSPSYEVRLAKYSARAFEVYVPSLARTDIDPTIYERSILTTTDVRFAFLESRRTLRGRPNPLNRYNRRSKRKFKGDLKAEGLALGGLEMNDYDVASLHIPYGPGWDARRIDKLVYQTDVDCIVIPAFFGTIEECLEDCCEHCPAPIDEDERKLQAEEDEGYIRGRISFIQDDPGRQTLSGSFNPIDVGEWSAQVYIGPTERFFAAIAAHDRAGVARMLGEGQDVNRRDHVGRSAAALDVACDLIDAGARMTARTPQYDLLPVVRKLLERSAVNAEQVAKGDDWSSEEDNMAVSDEEDGDSEGSDGDKPKKSNAADRQSEVPTNAGDLPEDEADQPDIFEINQADWDMSFTALAHAIVFGSLPIVEALINAGADVKLVSQAKGSSHAVIPLMLTILSDDDERTCKIAERLILAGASCSAANPATVFHRAVVANRPNLVSTFLRCDPNAKAVLNYPTVSWSGALAPVVTAITLGNYSVFAAMVAHGCKLVPSEEDVQRAYAASPQYSYVHEKQYFHPVETALCRHDDIVRLLADLGAETNVGVKRALTANSRPEDRRTLVDWVQYALTTLEIQISELDNSINPPKVTASEALPGWKGHLATCISEAAAKTAKYRKSNGVSYEETRRAKLIEIREYFTDMEKFLLERGAKPWSVVYPDNVSTAFDPKINQFGNIAPSSLFGRRGNKSTGGINYYRLAGSYNQEAVPAFQDALYDELYEACFTGANEKIQELCLPAGNPKKNATLLQIAVSGRRREREPLQSDSLVGAGLIHAPQGLPRCSPPVAARHWDTARLVIAIAAAAMYDSDNESDASDDSDGTVEQDTINFVDIASRPSTIECDPSVNVLNLYKHAPKHIELPTQVFDYIRRTGMGIKIQATVQEGEEVVPVVNDKNKVYLGLSVHGKKRTDLATRNDPNASQQEVKAVVLLVWQAVMQSATGILDYLLGDRPLAAYKCFPSGLDGASTPLGESPLTAAIASRKLDIVKYLFEKSPRLMASSLHERIKFHGINPLMLAVQRGCDTGIIDFLLAKSVSPAETDQTRGWNIFHHMCNKNDNELLKHLLNKLPRDVVETLLAQQSRGRLNTPLHLCAKQGFKKSVQLVVEFSKSTVLVRDVDGSIPLHCAVRSGFPETIQVLIDAAPSGLRMENGVGEAPFEIANLQDLTARNEQLKNQDYGAGFGGGAQELQNVAENPPRLDIDRLDVELPKFRTTLETLASTGILKQGTKAPADMFAFAEHMEWKLVAAKAARNVDAAAESARESGNSAKALANIKAALGVVDGHRELVHLVDVQTSVQSTLSRLQSAPAQDSSSRTRDEDGLEPEEDAEQQELRGSFVHGYVQHGPDTL
ncbi:ankyrin repeat protein [Mycena vulgaris]|nr:ankyrin repeat protein [Mycena vulgaris]